MSNQFVTRDTVKIEVDKVSKKMTDMISLVVVVLVLGFLTLLIAVVAMLLDGWRYREAAFQELSSKINTVYSTDSSNGIQRVEVRVIK